MNISVIGSGYVGLASGIGLATKDHEVVFMDVDEEKIEKINQGTSPIYENNLQEKMDQVIDKTRATSDIKEAVKETEISLITVGTPMKKDGEINLDQIKKAARDLGKALESKKGYHLVAVKSTVTPETTEKEIIPVLEKESGKTVGKDFGVCANPEFLREGNALEDFLNPDRIVIGEYDQESGDVLKEIYTDFEAPLVRTDLKTAEMIKYASNSLLATKISLINEIGNLCKELGINTYEVADAVGLDHRINREFLNSGCGFGGSCFTKDINALTRLAEKQKTDTELLESVIKVNRKQKRKMIDLLKDKLGSLENRRIAVLGLSFKPGTADVRKSPAITLIGELKAEGAEIVGCDPKAVENMKQVYPDIEYTEDYSEALKDAEGALIVTDWEEFNHISPEKLPDATIEGRKLDKAEGICW